MKTKKFLLATAGSTVDGRTIDQQMLEQMASSYDPKTYGARLNIEHIRGLGTEGPFRAYGDVLELSTDQVEVNFNGQKEKRLGLYGTFEVDDSAKQLNDAGQKVYPSIEIEPNFAGKGFAYLMGCALTDSPASIGTERLSFNRSLPGTVSVHAQDGGIEAASLEFDDNKVSSEAKGMFAAFTDMMKSFTASNTPEKSKEEQTPAAGTVVASAQKPADPTAQFTAMMGVMVQSMETAMNAQASATNSKFDQLTAEIGKLSNTIDTTAAPSQHRRPVSNGTDFTKTDC